MPRRSDESLARTGHMHAIANFLLAQRGTIVAAEPRGSHFFITVRPPEAEPITAWVKCAWRNDGSLDCAAMIKARDQDDMSTDRGAFDAILASVERTREKGATHLFLLGADPLGVTPVAAYLMPLDGVRPYLQQILDAGLFDRIRNGIALDFYVAAEAGSRKEPLVPVLGQHALDLLREPPVRVPHLDAIQDLDGDAPGDEGLSRVQHLATTYPRDGVVRAKVMKRAAGRCEWCGDKGFALPKGGFYLEAHHIIALANQGKDTLANVLALCPGHHREAHYGKDREALETRMLAKLAMILEAWT